MKNKCFFEPNQLIENMHKIQHLPSTIVHGRYDSVCAARSAWVLHKAWPNSTLHYVTQAGHSIADYELGKKLKQCMDEIMASSENE